MDDRKTQMLRHEREKAQREARAAIAQRGVHEGPDNASGANGDDPPGTDNDNDD